MSDELVCAKCGWAVGPNLVQRGIDGRLIGLCHRCRGERPLSSSDPELAKKLADAERLRPIKSRLTLVVTRAEYELLEADRQREKAARVEVSPELSPWAELVPVEKPHHYGRKSGA